MSITMSEILSKMKVSYDQEVALAKARRANLRSRGIHKGATLLAKVIKRARKVDESAKFETYVYTESSRLIGDVYVNTDSLKSEEVLKFMEYVEDSVAVCKGSDDFANSSMAQRSFVFGGEFLYLTVIFNLPTDGELCRRIQTGTKMVEQPSYKLECA